MRRRVIVVVLAAMLGWTAGAAASPSPWTGRYVVRAGDSLTAIAERYGVSFQDLARRNGLDWRAPLLIGVTLRVPSSAAAKPGWTGTYVVRSGDTLSGIALHYHVSLARLASVNRIDPAGVLLIGTRLQVPSATVNLDRIVESNPYRPGAVGYDVSYPNCGAAVPAGEFAIIGLNRGRPFTVNPCFASEWAAAKPPRSVYINTAYDATLMRHVTPDCDAAGRRQPLRPAGQRAYAVGCAEAAAALQLLGRATPIAIWLDVEPDNTWSARRSLNVATIKGILDRLLARSPHPAIGVYSNASIWHQIVGDWTSLDVPEWIATGAPDPPGCPAGFAAGPVWLNQSAGGEIDLDTAC